MKSCKSLPQPCMEWHLYATRDQISMVAPKKSNYFVQIQTLFCWSFVKCKICTFVNFSPKHRYINTKTLENNQTDWQFCHLLLFPGLSGSRLLIAWAHENKQTIRWCIQLASRYLQRGKKHVSFKEELCKKGHHSASGDCECVLSWWLKSWTCICWADCAVFMCHVE